MKLRCQINKIHDIKSPEGLARVKKRMFLGDGETYLEVGKEYTAYGIVFWEGTPWYYICMEDTDDYPIPMAADFFSITDNRVSPHWCLASDYKTKETFIVIKEWADDCTFYEHLLDEDPHVVATFLKYKKILDDE